MLAPNLQHQVMQSPTSVPNSTKVVSDEFEMISLIDGKVPGEWQNNNNLCQRSDLPSQALMVNTNSIGLSLLFPSTCFQVLFSSTMSVMLPYPEFLLLSLIVRLGLGTAVLSYRLVVASLINTLRVISNTLSIILCFSLHTDSYVYISFFPSQHTKLFRD